ncbi:ABC transporter ATP-binding protein [Tsukamurella sp. 1534]|uniref:ABC transporter ATP-binding protein n=1 Tax=Tsukamurella sp. 1534 TaxID=1151061 RepID=UPI000312837A|nr:ABC transporter ATP-binding protein [Tsukamurella sp. 1534]
MTAAVSVTGVAVRYGSTEVLRGVTLPPLPAGEVTALVGPNGAGKSTLLRSIAGLQRHTGTVTGEQPLYLPQDPPPPSTLTVFEAVLLALRRRSSLRVPRADGRRVARVLDDLAIADLSTRSMARLSGGQRQLVSFAQAVVRRPGALLLDEPTSSLDLHNQLTLLGAIRRYAHERPATVVVCLHDLGHAARFADRVVVLRDGAVHSTGTPQEVITEAMLREVYRVVGSVIHTDDGTPSIAVSGPLGDHAPHL